MDLLFCTHTQHKSDDGDKKSEAMQDEERMEVVPTSHTRV